MNRICLLLLCVGLILISSAGISAPLRVDIAIPSRSASYTDFAKAIRHNLLLLRHDLAIDIIVPDDEPDLAGRTRHRDDLVIAVGDSLLDWASSTDNPYPHTLAFYVSAAAFGGLALPMHTDLSALFRDQPLLRQMGLARLLLPQFDSTVMLIDNSGAPHGLWELASRPGLDISVLNIEREPNWPRTLSQLMATHDLLLAHDDPQIYNRETVRSLLLTTYRHGKVMIGPNQAFVEAGSLASVYTSSEQHLRQLSDTVEAFLQRRELPPPRFPIEYRVAINRQVAASLGMKLPAEVELADRLRQLESSP